MRCKVELYVAGQTFTEEVRAVDYQEARQVALARNPNATIISVNATAKNIQVVKQICLELNFEVI